MRTAVAPAPEKKKTQLLDRELEDFTDRKATLQTVTIPNALGRLAEITGGTHTSGTDHLASGLEKARAHLACRYTLGFTPADQRLDVDRDIRVAVKGTGLRAVAANRFEFRSPETKKESLLLAAFSNPGKAQNGILRAHVFPVDGADKGRWKARIALSFPLRIEGEGTVSRDFAVVLSQGSRVVHSFDRKVTVTSRGVRGPRQRQVSFLEPVVLKPGDYDLRVVLSSAEGDVASTWAETIEVPGMPEAGAFLLGPVLGRRSGTDVVVHGAGQTSLGKKGKASEEAAKGDVVGAAGAFEPLLIQQARTGEAGLALLTSVCDAGGSRTGGKTLRVQRQLTSPSGSPAGDPVEEDIVLPDRADSRCRTFVDPLPAGDLTPGEYRFEVLLEQTGRDGVADVRASTARVQILGPDTAAAPATRAPGS